MISLIKMLSYFRIFIYKIHWFYIFNYVFFYLQYNTIILRWADSTGQNNNIAL